MLFTGDLNRKIITNPFYFKTEKEYLRSVIARISFSTTIVPKGVYKLDEDEPSNIVKFEPEEDENGNTPSVIPPVQEMCKLSNWVHYTRNILHCNRLKHQDPEAPEGGDGEEEEFDADKAMAEL